MQDRLFFTVILSVPILKRRRIIVAKIATFFERAKSCDEERAEIAHESGSDGSFEKYSKAYNLVCQVAAEGNVQMLKSLIARRVPLDYRSYSSTEYKGWSAIQIAARNGYCEIVDILIKSGADVND